MSEEDKILIERERIKAIIERKIEGIDIICKRKRRGEVIARTKAIEMLKDVLYLIDTPDYIPKPKTQI